MRLAPFAALAACIALLCGCMPHGQAAATPETAQTPAPTAAAQPEPSAPLEGAEGGIHLISELLGGRRYEYKTFDYQQPGGGAMAMGLLTVIDCEAGTAQPLCHRDGCAHDQPGCSAWLTPNDGSLITLAADGDTLYLLHDAVDGDAWLEARSLADDATRVLCTLPRLEADREYDWALAAADEGTLYLNAANYPSVVDFSVPREEQAAVLAVDKVSGDASLCTNREAPPAGSPRPADQRVANAEIFDAQDGFLYLWLGLSGDGAEVWRLEPATGLWSMTARYTRTGFWQEDGLSGYDNRVAPARAGRQLPGGPLVHVDEQAGTLSAIDTATGQERTLCTGLPQAAGRIANYDVQALPGWYVVTVHWLDWTTQQTSFRQFLIPAEGGSPVEVSFSQYSAPRGSQSVHFLDQYGGQFYCQYEIRGSGPQPGIDKDGMPYTYEAWQLVYGLLPVEDALAGRGNFTELYLE